MAQVLWVSPWESPQLQTDDASRLNKMPVQYQCIQVQLTVVHKADNHNLYNPQHAVMMSAFPGFKPGKFPKLVFTACHYDMLLLAALARNMF